MSQSMQWNKWSGFTGEGTYVIFNKESLTCLNLEEGSKQPDTKLWHIRKRNEADIYYIERMVSETVLTASGESIWSRYPVAMWLSGIPGPDKFVVGMPKVEHKFGSQRYKIPTEALWVIDKSIYGLEPGKMVVFRNVKYPGYVLDLHHGEKDNGTSVNIIQERGLSDKREMQKWLLQVQPGMLPRIPPPDVW
ncbi:MAG: hypothetical protein L6R38_007127 [Xanthoria sp. 2 TBL-2021]|nr:MAG: hypothetical protein L6R38_007127 [Xanthoria sp. 2 TBL-2021]